MSNDAYEFLMGAGVPSAKFPTIGSKVVGVVTAMEKTQQRDINGELKFYDGGDPMMQVVITLQTEEIDPTVEHDDGRRKLYCKGAMIGAVKAAVVQSGHEGELIGGKLGVTYTSDGERKRGMNPPKQYVARFRPGNVLDVPEEPEAPPAPPADDATEEPF